MTDNHEPMAMTIEPVEVPQEPHDEGVKFVLEQLPKTAICIKVVGIGGCGGNVLDTLIADGIGQVDYVAVNTDEQALETNRAPTKLQIGLRTTQGHGTGSNPQVGKQAALENTEDLTELLSGADMVFLVTGLGGGTGTGAAPVIASLAKQMGALTVATVIKPFAFEGARRARIADEGLDRIVENVDTAIVIQNERLLTQVESGTGFFEGFQAAHQIVSDTLQGLTGILGNRGIMNTDFADVRAVLEEAGMAVVGTAQRSGRDAAMQAARDAMASHVVESEGLVRARKVLINLTGSAKFGMHDATEALQLIQREVSSDAELIIGVVQDEVMGETVRVMMIASGFSQDNFRLRGENEGQAIAPSDIRPQPSWQSERAVDLVNSAPLPPMAPEAAVSDNDMAPAVSLPHPGEPAVQPRIQANGSGDGADEPLDFMPPPAAVAHESDEDGPARTGFFGRRSIFR
jgi:cell division protein FtsZ